MTETFSTEGDNFLFFFFLFLGFTFPVSTARQFPFRLQNGGRSHTTAITITRVRQLEEIIIVIMNVRPTFFALKQQDTFSSFCLSFFPFPSHSFLIRLAFLVSDVRDVSEPASNQSTELLLLLLFFLFFFLLYPNDFRVVSQAQNKTRQKREVFNEIKLNKEKCLGCVCVCNLK